LGRRGRKKEWRERRDSRTWCGGEEGERNVRRRGRLLMCEAEERSWFPRVFSSATPYRPFFFFLGGSTHAMVRHRRGTAAAQGLVELRVWVLDRGS